MLCDLRLHIFAQYVTRAGYVNEEVCGRCMLHMKEMVHKQLWSDKVKGKNCLENVGGGGRTLKDKTIAYSFLECYRINENIGILWRIFNIIYSKFFPGNFQTLPFAGQTLEQ